MTIIQETQHKLYITTNLIFRVINFHVKIQKNLKILFIQDFKTRQVIKSLIA